MNPPLHDRLLGVWPNPLHVQCSPKILAGFRAAAKRHYPIELYSVLFGKINGDSISIEDIWYPPGVQGKAQTDYIFARKSWLSEALAMADSAGMAIVADLHSHPDCISCEPSEADWDCTPEGWLHGICAVHKLPDGRKRARIRFWPSIRRIVRKGAK